MNLDDKTTRCKDENLVFHADIQQHDVMLGKGALCVENVGTIAFKAVINARIGSYLNSSASKNDKKALTLKVLAMVRGGGARFLNQRSWLIGSNLWYELNSAEARIKIRDAFRDVIKNIRNKRRPSAFLDKIGLSQRFNKDSTYVSIVDHVTNSSDIRNYISSRYKLREERKQKRHICLKRKSQKCESTPPSCETALTSNCASATPCNFTRATAATGCIKGQQESTVASVSTHALGPTLMRRSSNRIATWTAPSSNTMAFIESSIILRNSAAHLRDEGNHVDAEELSTISLSEIETEEADRYDRTEENPIVRRHKEDEPSHQCPTIHNSYNETRNEEEEATGSHLSSDNETLHQALEKSIAFLDDDLLLSCIDENHLQHYTNSIFHKHGESNYDDDSSMGGFLESLNH